MSLPREIMDICYLNGAWVPRADATISAFDRGFLVADGIFETIYVARGAPWLLEAHLDRFARSAAYVQLTDPPSAAALTDLVATLIARNGLDRAAFSPEAAVRVTVSRGVLTSGPPTVFAFARTLSAAHLAKRERGVLGFLLPYTRGATGPDLAMHKTLSYLASSLGQLVLGARTDDPRAEGFFADGDGHLLEGTGSNLFIVEADALVTAPVSMGVLPGTSRALVCELAPELGLRVVEAPFDATRLAGADEAFITSSTLRVAPLVGFEGQTVGSGARGAVVARLQAAFEARVDAEVQRWHARRTTTPSRG